MNPATTRLGRWLTRWFPYTAMDGRSTGWSRGRFVIQGPLCPSLHRWTIWSRPKGRKVYLHAWEADDWSRDLHDHSTDMWSIGLWGSYTEVTDDGERTYRAPWVRWFPATHRHRIAVRRGPVWTLVLAGAKTRHSAFYVDGVRVPIDEYQRRYARRHRSCA